MIYKEEDGVKIPVFTDGEIKEIFIEMIATAPKYQSWEETKDVLFPKMPDNPDCELWEDMRAWSRYETKLENWEKHQQSPDINNILNDIGYHPYFDRNPTLSGDIERRFEIELENRMFKLNPEIAEDDSDRIMEIVCDEGMGFNEYWRGLDLFTFDEIVNLLKAAYEVD